MDFSDKILAEAKTDFGDATVWPWNLISAINNPPPFSGKDDREFFDLDNPQMIPQDFVASLLYAMHTLYPREYSVLLMRYIEGKNLEEIGKEFNVTRERIRQIEAKAIRKLRHPKRMKYIRRGVSGMMLDADVRCRELEQEFERLNNIIKCMEIEKEKPEKRPYEDDNPKSIPIGDLGLSVRTYNCLARHLYWEARKNGLEPVPFRNIQFYVDDILHLTADDLIGIRNLGRKSLMELTEKMHSLGFEWFPLEKVGQDV